MAKPKSIAELDKLIDEALDAAELSASDNTWVSQNWSRLAAAAAAVRTSRIRDRDTQ